MTSLEASHAAPMPDSHHATAPSRDRDAAKDAAPQSHASSDDNRRTERSSPDLLWPTDRYRLMTPYKLRF